MSNEGSSEGVADTKWDSLIKYSDSLRDAVTLVSPLGNEALERYKKIYLIVNNQDKAVEIARDFVDALLLERHADKDCLLPNFVTREYRGIPVNASNGNISFVVNGKTYWADSDSDIDSRIDALLDGGPSQDNDLNNAFDDIELTRQKHAIDLLDVSPNWKRYFWARVRLDAAKARGINLELKSSEKSPGFQVLASAFFFGPILYFTLGMWKRSILLVGLSFLLATFTIIVGTIFGFKYEGSALIWLAAVFVCMIRNDYYDFKVRKRDVWDSLKIISHPGLTLIVSVLLLTGSFLIIGSVNTLESLMIDVNGVWRDPQNRVVEIRLGKFNSKIVYEGKKYAVTPKRSGIFGSGIFEGILVLDVVGQPRPWTLREVQEEKGFSLLLTINDTDDIALDYVRP